MLFEMPKSLKNKIIAILCIIMYLLLN